jgi:Zn-dependent peptidase ImmA (M78 family)
MNSAPQLLTEREIEAKVIDLVALARKRYGTPERCRAQDACQALGLRLVRRELPRGIDGMITPDGRVIVSAAIVWSSRLEFTAYHEITHYLLEEDGELIEFFTEALRGTPSDYERAIERCCQIGAAEFMIPRERARDLIAERGFSVELIEPLAGLNGASIAAAAVQVAICAPVDCYVIVCQHGVSPLWPHDHGLYVEQAVRHADSQYPLIRGTVIPVDHLLYQVWEIRQPLAGPSKIPFRSGKHYSCDYGEAKRVGGQVVGILYMGVPPRKGQLSLGL